MSLNHSIPSSFSLPRRGLILGLAPAVIGGLVMMGSTSALAAVYSVTSAADAGPGSLRDAVTLANNSAGLDTIDVVVVGPIALTSGDIDITDPVYIEGHGVVIDASANGDRIFETTAGADTTLREMTLGNATGLTVAGGCIHSASQLTLEHVALDQCQTTGSGGAIYHRNGNLELLDVSITNSSANQGGAINCNSATSVSIEGSVFDGNSTTGQGGHLYAGGSTGSVSILDTKWINGSAYRGGAIFTGAGTTGVSYSDLIDNTAGDFGGAIVQRGANAYLSLYYTTASGNFADHGGVLYASGGVAHLEHAELVDNTAAGSGGAIYGKDLLLELYDSFVSGNQAVAEDGGGIYLIGGSALSGNASAVTANEAGRDGGGIFADIEQTALPMSGRLSMTNFTVHSNVAGREGGGLWITDTMSVPNEFSMHSSTVAFNTAAVAYGGLYVNYDVVWQIGDYWTGNVFDGNTVAGVPDDCEIDPGSLPLVWVDNLIFAPSTCGAAISGQSALLPPSPAPTDICLVPGAGSPVVDANNYPFAPLDDILHQARSSPGDMGSCEQ